MLTHPKSCAGCPLDPLSSGWMRQQPIGGNGVVLVGEALGKDEAASGDPFQGAAGEVLNKILLRGGMKREDFTISNTIFCRPPDNKLNGVWYMEPAINHCRPNLDGDLKRAQPRCIVALGAVALKRLLPAIYEPITKARGYVFWSAEYQCWVIPTLHPSFAMRGKTAYYGVIMHDIQRAVEIAEKGFSYAPLDYTLDCTPLEAMRWVDEFEAYYSQHPELYLSCDIETPFKQDEDEEDLDPEANGFTDVQIDRCGYSYRDGHALSIPWGGVYQAVHERLLYSRCQKVWWNLPFDVPHIQSTGLCINGSSSDGMVAWHILNSDLRKSLGFVAPFFAKSYPMWKHTSHLNPAHYNAMDADVAGINMRGIEHLLKLNKMWDVYHEYVRELDPVYAAMSAAGMPVDYEKRSESAKLLTQKRDTNRATIELHIPAAIRSYDPKKGFVKVPSSTEGLEQITVSGIAKRYCSACGEYSPKTAHTAPRKRKLCEVCHLKWTGKHAKGDTMCNSSIGVEVDVNPCSGVEVIDTVEDVVRWARPVPFLPSTVNIFKYQTHHKIPLIQTGFGADKKGTADEKAIRKLMGKYPDDPFFPLVLDDREYNKIGGSYIGWAEEDGDGVTRIVSGFPVGKDGRVRGTFCVTGEHEVLTQIGWERFDKYVQNPSPIATWQAGTVSFNQPYSITNEEYSGEMVNISTRRVAILATPNHRVLYKYPSYRKGDVIWRDKVKPIDNLPSQVYLYCGGTHQGTEEFTDWWALGMAIQADANVRSTTVRFAFDKERKSERLIGILTRLGVQFVESKRKSHPLRRVFTVNIADCAPAIDLFVGPEKSLLWSKFLNLTTAGKLAAIEESTYWDGYRGEYYSYFSTNSQNVQLLQTLAHLTGNSATFVREEYQDKKDFFRVTYSKNQSLGWVSKSDLSRESFSGRVYCVSVSSEFFLVRYRGRIHVTGNTHNPSTLRASMVNPSLQTMPRGDDSEIQQLVKQMFVAPEGKIFVARDFSGIEAQLVGVEANDRDYLRLAKIDIHSYYTAYQLYRQGILLASDLPDLGWDDSKLRASLKGIKSEFPAARNIGKRCIHAGNYRVGANKLHEEYPKWFPKTKDAAMALGLYYEVFPKIPIWHETLCKEVDKTSVCRNAFGHVHRFHSVLKWTKRGNEWHWDYGDDSKRLIAFRPQSNAAFIAKASGKRMFYNYPETMAQWLRLFIHDEWFTEPPVEMADEADRILQVEMEKPIPEIPLPESWQFGSHLKIESEGKRGYAWSSMK